MILKEETVLSPKKKREKKRKKLKRQDMKIPTAPERSSWLLRSQPEERTALHTRQGPSPPGGTETNKCEVSIIS